MPFKITYTERFLKHYEALNSIEKKQLKNKLVFLIANPLHPSLRVKRIKGLKKEVYGIREKIASGKQPVFDDLDALFEKLDKH